MALFLLLQIVSLKSIASLPGNSSTSKSSSRRSHNVVPYRPLGILVGAGTLAYLSRGHLDNAALIHRLDDSGFDLPIDLGDRYGDGFTLGLGAVGTLALAEILQDERIEAFGQDLALSLLLTGGVVWTLKLAIDEKRPNGGSYSFPSGHTAAAFASAPVIQSHLGWRFGIPAYALAVFTGLGRIEDRKHYSSDVLVGGAIGLVIGSEVVASGERVGGLLDHILVSPPRLGVKVSW